MNITPGPWTYNSDFREVQCLDRIIAVVIEGQEGASEEEKHANGYLMAASVELRDELANLSRVVRAYTESGIEPNTIEENRLFGEMEVMLERSEHALGRVFPPEGTS